MSIKARYIVIFILLAIIFALTAWKYTFRKSASSVAGKEADIEIQASRLAGQFEMNEDSANLLYLDKVILVSGTVESCTTDSTGASVYLREEGSTAGVLCSFDRSTKELASIQSGMKVTIKGICTGYLLDVVMNKCVLSRDTQN
jgi:predicted aconitase